MAPSKSEITKGTTEHSIAMCTIYKFSNKGQFLAY